MGHYTGGNIYTASFKTTALTTVSHDIWVLTAGSTATIETRVALRRIEIEHTATNDAIGVEIWRGSTGASTGGAITPVNVKGWTGALTASSSVTGISTSVISTTSASRLYAGTFSDGNKFEYEPCREERPIIVPAQALHVNISAPSSGNTTMYGTLTFEELGKNPID